MRGCRMALFGSAPLWGHWTRRLGAHGRSCFSQPLQPSLQLGLSSVVPLRREASNDGLRPTLPPQQCLRTPWLPLLPASRPLRASLPTTTPCPQSLHCSVPCSAFSQLMDQEHPARRISTIARAMPAMRPAVTNWDFGFGCRRADGRGEAARVPLRVEPSQAKKSCPRKRCLRKRQQSRARKQCLCRSQQCRRPARHQRSTGAVHPERLVALAEAATSTNARAIGRL